VKTNSKTTLTFGDLIENLCTTYGKHRATEILRLVVKAHLVVFPGRDLGQCEGCDNFFNTEALRDKYCPECWEVWKEDGFRRDTRCDNLASFSLTL